MKRIFWLVLAFMLAACQPTAAPSHIAILDGGKITSLQTADLRLSEILRQAGVTLASGDEVQYNLATLPADFSLPQPGDYTLQILRAIQLTLITPDSQTTLKTTAPTVGQALVQTGLSIDPADYIAPPLDTPLTADLTVTYRPARDLTILTGSRSIPIRSSATVVGAALASAGFALQGLDRSLPAEDQPLPADGIIHVIRVREAVTLLEKSIPFDKKVEYSTSLDTGTQKVLQAGVPGLAVSRVRIRYEDGVEVARTTEAETVLRQPQQSIIALGSHVQVQTLDIPGGQVQYWRAVQMYATAYSPCRSGTAQCSYGTASGLPVRQGVVAMVRSLFNQLAGSQVYIPGYGLAVIADVGGGFPDGRLWVDLGYSDDDYQSWSGMVTVYFLVPAPASIPAVLE